jgi:hypothetical protein
MQHPSEPAVYIEPLGKKRAVIVIIHQQGRPKEWLAARRAAGVIPGRHIGGMGGNKLNEKTAEIELP